MRFASEITCRYSYDLFQDRTVGTVGDSIVEVYKREFTKRGEMRIVDRDMTVSPKGVEDVYVIEYSPKVHHQS